VTFYFCYKTQHLILKVGHLAFFNLNLVLIFEKIDAIWLFSLNLLKRIKRFFIHLDYVNCTNKI